MFAFVDDSSDTSSVNFAFLACATGGFDVPLGPATVKGSGLLASCADPGSVLAQVVFALT